MPDRPSPYEHETTAPSKLIQAEGLDDDEEGPDVDADIARLRASLDAKP
jgi:hypothetical protein